MPKTDVPVLHRPPRSLATASGRFHSGIHPRRYLFGPRACRGRRICGAALPQPATRLTEDGKPEEGCCMLRSRRATPRDDPEVGRAQLKGTRTIAVTAGNSPAQVFLPSECVSPIWEGD